MVPPAPPMFSTITGWPSVVFIRSATRRDTMSVMPPAGNGTIQVMGLLGNVSARALRVPPSATAHANRNDTHRIGFLPDCLSACCWVEHGTGNRGAKARRSLKATLLHLDAGGLDHRPPFL